MLPLEHSAILSTFIKLPFVIKIIVLSIFEWPLKTDFAVYKSEKSQMLCIIYLIIYNNIAILHIYIVVSDFFLFIFIALFAGML